MGVKMAAARLRRTREHLVTLDEGKSVTFLRPLEARWGEMLMPDLTDPKKLIWSVGIEQVREFVIGWSGIKESDLLGPEIGGNDEVDFDVELWDEVCSDHVDWVGKVAAEMLDAIVAASKKKAEAEKNSETV